MSSTVKLYKNITSQETINKQPYLTQIEELTGEFRDNIDILNPVITVQLTNTTTAAKIMSECNYVYITAFSRYYYVTGIRAVSNNVVELSCRVDVLYSWKTPILEQVVLVARNERQYSLYLDDGILKLYNNPNITTIEFPSGFSAEEFILAVAGG